MQSHSLKVVPFDKDLVELDRSQFAHNPGFVHSGIGFRFSEILKVKLSFANTLGKVDALNRGAKGEVYYVRPNEIVEFAPNGRVLNSTKSFDFFMRPFDTTGIIEPRVYDNSHCEKIALMKMGKVESKPNLEYSLYLLEIANEMMEFAEEALSQNKLGLAMHFNRYVIEFAAKSILPALGKSWPKPEHDVSKELRQRDVRANFKSSMSLDEIAWDLGLWSNPPRLDLYGDPEASLEPSSIIPLDEIQMVRQKAQRIYNAVLENFENLHVKKI